MEVLIGYMIDGRNSGIDKYLLRVLRVFYDAGIHADILTGKDNVDLRACLAPFKAEIHEIPGLMHPQKQYKAMRKILSQNLMMQHISIFQSRCTVLVPKPHTMPVYRA